MQALCTCMLICCVYLFFCGVFIFCLPRPVRGLPPVTPRARTPRPRPQVEEGCEGELVVCLPDPAVDPALYAPQLLYLQRPLEAPVSPAEPAAGRRRGTRHSHQGELPRPPSHRGIHSAIHLLQSPKSSPNTGHYSLPGPCLY